MLIYRRVSTKAARYQLIKQRHARFLIYRRDSTTPVRYYHPVPGWAGEFPLAGRFLGRGGVYPGRPGMLCCRIRLGDCIGPGDRWADGDEDTDGELWAGADARAAGYTQKAKYTDAPTNSQAK